MKVKLKGNNKTMPLLGHHKRVFKKKLLLQTKMNTFYFLTLLVL